MRKKTSRKARYLRYAALVLAIVCVVSAGFFFLQLWEKGQGDFTDLHPDDSVLEYAGNQYELKKNIETFLVLGLDKFEDDSTDESYNNDKQADFLMLFVLDNDAQTCTAIHINRDTMANVQVLGVAGDTVATLTKQIALAHTYGNGQEMSCRNTAEAVSDLLMGMKIDHYISATMDAVPILNDLLGGVQVEVLDDFSGIDDTLVKGETVTLMGVQALTYVRARAGLEDSSNAARMVRQRQYLNALGKKAQERSAADEDFVADATMEMADYIVSDRSVTQLQELLRKLSTYEFVGMRDIPGETKMGERFLEFYPESAAIEELVVQLFYKQKG